ncbi:MAG: hypothetical protein QNJ62_05020 [Methyloceanibacter sp.]|nr:hypothetical protein [Methyloceanibacter sp.]
MCELTNTQRKALRSISDWAGDLPIDFEEQIGCYGAARDAVLGSLGVNGYLLSGERGTYVLTDKAKAALSGPTEA